jgi:hypothetical protein
MLFRKLFILAAMAGYLYVLAFDIFLTDTIRIPAPFVFLVILLPFFNHPIPSFAYLRETFLFALGLFLYYVIGMVDYRTFVAMLICIVMCALYFNYFVGTNRFRFNVSVVIFFAFLMLSMLIMLLDHSYADKIDPLREKLLDTEIRQSPAGISDTQFTFGYQIAAFTVFVFVCAFVFRQYLAVKVLVLAICIGVVYLGMNRSAFMSFIVVASLFLIFYYRFKAVFVIAAAVLIGFGVYTVVLKNNADDKHNILAKNIAKQNIEVDRADLADENLKIIANYPFGLIFYGKTWEQVTYRSSIFTFGLTSHNAYLMFITLVGPILGVGIIGGIYFRIMMLFFQTAKNIRQRSHALLAALIFSFLSASINALFHNAWVFSADGPTLFLYFSILQGAKIYLGHPTAQHIHQVRIVTHDQPVLNDVHG